MKDISDANYYVIPRLCVNWNGKSRLEYWEGFTDIYVFHFKRPPFMPPPGGSMPPPPGMIFPPGIPPTASPAPTSAPPSLPSTEEIWVENKSSEGKV